MLYLIKKFYIWKCKSHEFKAKKALDLADKTDSLLAFYHKSHNREDGTGDDRWANLLALLTNIRDYANCLRVETKHFLLKLESNEGSYKEIFKIAKNVAVASHNLSEFICALEKIKEYERTGKKNTWYNAHNIYFRRRS